MNASPLPPAGLIAPDGATALPTFSVPRRVGLRQEAL